MSESGAARRPRLLEGVRPAVQFAIQGRVPSLVAVAVTGFSGGFCEAIFLVTMTRTAFAITEGRARVGIVAGWYLSVNQALVLAFAISAVRLCLSALGMWQSTGLSAEVVARVRRRLSEAFLASAWAVQQEQRAGSLQELVTGYSAAASGVMGSVSGGLVATANLVALLATAIVVDPLSALVLAVSVVGLGVIVRPLRLLSRRRARAAAEAGMNLATTVSEVADLGLELHIFNVQTAARTRISLRIEDAAEKSRRLSFVGGMLSPIYTNVAYAVLLSALAVIAGSRSASITSLGASLLVMLRSLGYGQSLQSAYLGLSNSVPAVDVLQERLRHFEASRRVDGGSHAGQVVPLTLDHVSFAYTMNQETLRDVSFTIEPREMVGIVGPSGGGKSTLVQLMLGLRDPISGRILANGRDISEIDKSEWTRKVTFVPQAAHLIAGTVADNIRFLREGVSSDEIERVARLAHLHDDIMGFSGGYDYDVGERGARLSGGQQQRVCVARALVGDPELLILDEPTSALDVRSEHLLRTTLLSLKDRMTIVVIAHRLSTITVCDRIMVIQAGELVAFDTPVELEKSSPFYREALILSGMR